MNTNRISVRYAKALFSAAQDTKVAEKVSRDMKAVLEAAKSEEFIFLLENPVTIPSKKVAVFKMIFGKSFTDLSYDFFVLLTKNKREAFLTSIARNYLSIYRKAHNITAVHLTTAQDVGKRFLSDIEKVVSGKFSTKVEMSYEVDNTLIGGFIIRMEDEQFDGSASNKLYQIKKELLNN